MAKFKKGQSGNPEGRKPGSGYASKLRNAIEDDLPDIIKSVVEQAKDGDTAAAKLLLDRVVPALKPQQEATVVEGLTGKSPSEQGTAIINAMGAGLLSPDQSQAMLAGLANMMKIVEIDELEKRLSALEKKDAN